MYDLIVVGGGPAGLTATIYAIRKRLNMILVSKDLGGKTNYHLALPWVEEYQVIRGLEVVGKFKSELEYLKFARHMETVVRIEKRDADFAALTESGGEFLAKAVIVATGVKQKRLGVPGEGEFTMRGLCYSALSYAPLFLDKTTIVIGDGDLALRSAAELATVAKHVHLVCGGVENLAKPLGKKLHVAQNVTFLEGYQVVEIQGNEYAERVVLESPSGQVMRVEADGTFIEMGLIPNSQLVADLVDLNEQERIIVDCAARTSLPGVFAAGDVTNTYAEQVLVAVGEGAKAALSAYEFLLASL